MPVPLYMQHPDRYMYNTDTKKHLLKTGSVFRKQYAEYPARFVESASMFPKPIQPPISLPLPPTPEPPPPGPHVGAPLPQPAPPGPSKEENENEQLRQRVRDVLWGELKQNPDQYAGKSADELSALFRKMLLARLGPDPRPPPINKVRASATKPSRYRLAKPQSPPSEDEEYFDDEDLGEDEEDF
jgi:hypothetical protein